MQRRDRAREDAYPRRYLPLRPTVGWATGPTESIIDSGRAFPGLIVEVGNIAEDYWPAGRPHGFAILPDAQNPERAIDDARVSFFATYLSSCSRSVC